MGEGDGESEEGQEAEDVIIERVVEEVAGYEAADNVRKESLTRGTGIISESCHLCRVSFVYALCREFFVC